MLLRPCTAMSPLPLAVVIMTMIGIISLAGIVVNNAIVLIDYTNSLRKRKRIERELKENEILSNEDLLECTIQGGKTRLRPVLLTAITTILGLIPIAIGFNIDFRMTKIYVLDGHRAC